MANLGANYRADKVGAAQRSRKRSAKGRDIARDDDGDLIYPEIADVRRRGRCRKSLRKFCETYNPDAFTLAWCADHLKAIARIEEAATHGALYCFAMPRGSGKSSIVRMATLWAISYGWRRYVFAIGANDDKAQKTLNAIKMFIRFLPTYAADFPEIAYPAECLGGLAQRAAGQLFDGEPTMIEWGGNNVVLPTMPPPPNWPKSWALRSDGMVPTSGAVISASGLTGDGIRGSLMTLTTGEQIRPDLVLLDDPQTPESARSPAQNANREQLIAADVLGMAGPGKTIAAVMPCTCIVPGDMVDSLLDRKRHPRWRGERTSLLRSMPTNLDAWERYREVWARCLAYEPPDLAEANEYYLAHREEMDAGADASWAERKLPEEVSAVQHAMHLYFADLKAFWSEYQNQPLPLIAPSVDELKPDAIAGRLNRSPRGIIPAGCTRLTAFIDVQQDLLPWVVCGWREGFGGAVVDYGAWPKQNRDYWTANDARPKLREATGVPSLEGSIYAGLGALADHLLGRDWPLQDGGILRVERCLIDSGWGQSTSVVRRFCRESKHAGVILPSKGIGISAAMVPMEDWPKKPGERRGSGWVIRPPEAGRGRVALFDASHWKSFCAARLRQPEGEAGALMLFGADAVVHRMFADHVTSEYMVKTFGRGRETEEWKLRPNRENHWLDCLVGCAVGASIQGCEVGGVPTAKAEKRRVSYAELQAKARANR